MWRSTPMASEHRRENQEIVLNISPDGNQNSSTVCISPVGYLWVRWLVDTLWIVNINSLFPYGQIYEQVGYESKQHTFLFSLTLLILLSHFHVFVFASSINPLLITITWRAQPEKIIKDDFSRVLSHPSAPTWNNQEMGWDKGVKPEAINSNMRADILRIIPEQPSDICVGAFGCQCHRLCKLTNDCSHIPTCFANHKGHLAEKISCR